MNKKNNSVFDLIKITQLCKDTQLESIDEALKKKSSN